MNKIINAIFSILKVFLLLVSFVLTFFIIVNMYRRLEKDLFDAIYNFIPFILLFVLFAINIIFKQKSVTGCLFYNVVCCLVFSMILLACYRTFFDENMVVYLRLGYNINFNYFADIIAPMRAMLYVLCVSNILLIIDGLKFWDKKEEIIIEDKKIEKKSKVKEKTV